ncbi:MAG: ACP S-malonyltransferase [candidate division WS1 bacterium]|nr:ACP S-malonyltransferase [candidate division WS1 bacterium]
MSKLIAFVFPGQNSHYVGMGRELYDAEGPGRLVLEVAEQTLGADLLSVMFEGPEDALTRTDNQQPAIVTHSLAALAELRAAGIEPDMVAGHSLGEYSAVACAGCLSPETLLPLVRFRGELMARAGDRAAGAMAAVLGLDTDAVEKAVGSAGEDGTVVVANYNSPGQVVISGEVAAVARAGELCKEAGAKRVIPLDVSGAFHSPLMAPAAEPLIERLGQTEFAPAAVPVVSNVDATPRTDPGEIRDALGRQMTSSVRWEQSVARMVAEGVDTVIEVGPGTVLSKLISRIDRSITVLNVDRPADVAAVAEQLG